MQEGETAVSVVPAGCFWAKLPRDGTTSWHPIVGHAADVAAVMDRLSAPDSVISMRLARAAGLGHLTAEIRAALVYLAALHDMGKASLGFQEKELPKGQRRRFPDTGHVQVVLKSRKYEPMAEILNIIQGRIGAANRAFTEIFRAALCHHGRPYDTVISTSDCDRLWERDGVRERDPIAEIRRLEACARRWSGIGDGAVSDGRLPAEALFTHVFAGAMTLADWVGSTESIFHLDPKADEDPDARWGWAQAQADRACAEIGLVPSTMVVGLVGLPLLERVFPKIFVERASTPTPLQAEVASMRLPERGARVLIESETGSGKTEAAIALYARLRAAGHVSGMVFALPTRASATAMFRRIGAAIEGMYTGSERPSVALAMGGEQPRLQAMPLLLEERTDYPDEEDFTGWAAEGTRRFFAAEIVVGTIDQVLLAGLAIRYAHLRLAPLTRHLLVVDELHSYDRYMTAVLSRVLDAHTRSGGVALFMSATLSDAARVAFSGRAESETTEVEAASRPYPLISLCAGPGAGWVERPVGTAGPNKVVEWELNTEAEGLKGAIEAARLGARVCVLRNTVRDARATITTLRDAGAAELLWRPACSTRTPAFHGRYALPDRIALDEAVLADFGREGPGRGLILVATQVAEQSLDLDFDLLVTDLCPIDVLLQRIGRLHRHTRPRPAGCNTARAVVIAPSEGLAHLRGRNSKGSNGWGTVYEDIPDLELTFRAIRTMQRIEIPRDNRMLIESVYHPDRSVALRSEGGWEECLDESGGRAIGRETQGLQSSLDFEASYRLNDERYGNDVVIRRTRIGDESIRVELPSPVRLFHGTAGRPVTHVDLPARKLMEYLGHKELRAEWIGTDGDMARFRIGTVEFAYGPDGWEW